MPGRGRTGAPAHITRKSKRPIRGCVSAGTGELRLSRHHFVDAGTCIVSARAIAEEFGAKFAAIPRVKHIEVIAIHLKTGLNDVPPARVDEYVVKLCDSRGKLLVNARGTQIGQGSNVNICNRPTG